MRAAHTGTSIPRGGSDGSRLTLTRQVLPALHAGLSCPAGQVDLKALKTLPPKPYTQGELIKAMKTVAKFVTDPRLKQKLRDTTGIGTEATRANIINGLIGRGYLVKKGRAVRASDAAFTLIDAVPSAIADPGTTAVWEQALDMIEAGPGLPAVRRTDAAAHGQERRVLVLLALPGLQGHVADRVPDGPAQRTAQAARCLQGVLILASPCRAGHFTGGEANVPHRAGLQSARLLLQRCARPVCPPSGDGARRSLLHESRPPPFP